MSTNVLSAAPARQMLKRLPAFSPIAIKVMALVADEKVSFKEVAKLFSLDPALTGQVLQLANSGMYGRQTAVQSVLHALARLGLENISRIAITAALAQGLPRHTSPWVRNWWRHSIAAALISDHLGAANLEFDFGYTAGLLHAIGQLALFQHSPMAYPDLMQSSRTEGADLIALEREHFGTDHAELSGLILREWGLPQNLVQAVSKYRTLDPADPLTAAVQGGCFYAESQGFEQCQCLQTIGDDIRVHLSDQYLLTVLSTEVNLIECSLI